MVRLSEIPLIAILLVVSGITLGVGATILNTYETSLTAGSTARNAVANVSAGVGNFAAQFPNIGLILALSAIIVVLLGAVAYFVGGGRGRR